MECKNKLESYFRENGIPFQTMTHPPVFTAPALAATQHIPGRQVAKVVMAMAGDTLIMLVVPANLHINFESLADVMHVTGVRLAREDEFSALFSDCPLGAMPPFGNLYGIPVYLDISLTDDPEIVFLAGTHTDTFRIRYSDYERLVKPQIAQFAL